MATIKKKDLELLTSFFLNMLRNILYSDIYHPACFDVLIESGFRIIRKIALPICIKHIVMSVIIISFSNFHFEWKRVGKKIVNHKTLNILKRKIEKYQFQIQQPP